MLEKTSPRRMYESEGIEQIPLVHFINYPLKWKDYSSIGSSAGWAPQMYCSSSDTPSSSIRALENWVS